MRTQTYVATSSGRVARSHVLAPTDLTFLVDECQRCFYRKVVLGQRRPSTPMPSVFSKLDQGQRQFFHGKLSSEIDASLPNGVIDCHVPRLLSAPLSIPGTSSTVQLRGALDALIRFDDGAVGIVDFKTSSSRDAHVPMYARQLNAYAEMLEHPAPLKFGAAPVTVLGLFCLDPNSLERRAGRLHHEMTATWIPVARDSAAFYRTLAFVCHEWLDRPTPPPPTPGCPWCGPRP